MAPSLREMRNKSPAAEHTSYLARFDGGNTMCRHIDSVLNVIQSTLIVRWILSNLDKEVHEGRHMRCGGCALTNVRVKEDY